MSTAGALANLLESPIDIDLPIAAPSAQPGRRAPETAAHLREVL